MSHQNDMISALAMLYLQNQDLSKITPEELACRYVEVREKIYKELSVDAIDVNELGPIWV